MSADDRDAILAATDLAALWATEGLHIDGRGRMGACPEPTHAQTGKTPPVAIGHQNGRGVWNCHGCGAGGSAVDLLTIRRGITVGEALDHLRRAAGMPERTPAASHDFLRLIPATKPTPTPRLKPAPVTPPVSNDPPAPDGTLEQFLEQRQWQPDVAERFGLAAHMVRGVPRVRFPFRHREQVIVWQDRAVNDAKPKWLTPTDAKLIPYAHDFAHALDATTATPGQRPSVIIVEGPPDVIALAHAHPAGGVIGLPGTAWARKPLLHSWLKGWDVIIAMDNDAPGEQARRELETGLTTYGAAVAHLRCPAAINDLDDWRRSAGDDFAAELDTALDLMEWVHL